MQRTALITGGTRGIGAAISVELKKAGYHVIANYVSNQRTAALFQQKHGIDTVRFDVSDFEACQKALNQIVTDHGPIDILVNNAGIIQDSSFVKMSYEKWHNVIKTNLDSCFNITKQVIDSMIERKFGRIINISSINGQIGAYGQCNYSAAKAGVIGFTKALAREVARHNITVNAIAPGYIATDMMQSVPEPALQKIISGIPAGRLGEGLEIARAVLFLAADEAGFCTGATMGINGGQAMLG